MSQSGINSATVGPSPPAVATSFTTNLGTAVPSANILDVKAVDVNANNDAGIQSRGGVSTVAGGTNDLEIQLTNRNTATVTTTDATPTVILSVPLGAGDGTYYAEGNLVAYNTTDDAGAAYNYIGAARSSSPGPVATEIGIEQKGIFEEASMNASDFSIAVAGNNIEITVVGIAGKTINWNVLFNYRYVG